MRIPVRINCIESDTQFTFVFHVDGFMIETQQFNGIATIVDDSDPYGSLPAYITFEDPS